VLVGKPSRGCQVAIAVLLGLGCDGPLGHVCHGVAALGAADGVVVVHKTDGSWWSWGEGVLRPTRSALDLPDKGTFLRNTLCLRAFPDPVLCPFSPLGDPPGFRATAEDVALWDDHDVTPSPSVCAVTRGHLSCYIPMLQSTVDVGDDFGTSSIGQDHLCGVKNDHTVECRMTGLVGPGDNDLAATWEHPLPELVGVDEMASTLGATCARNEIGEIWCWGVYSRLFPPPVLAPRLISTIGGAATALVAGESHFCALTKEGDVVCWGDPDATWVLDNGLLPSRVKLPRPATAIASGSLTMCALLDDTSVWCWGDGRQGQRGDGTDAPIADSTRARPVLPCD
jgi:Regulator of chromosome condensation (RCC1) repeat